MEKEKQSGYAEVIGIIAESDTEARKARISAAINSIEGGAAGLAAYTATSHVSMMF